MCFETETDISLLVGQIFKTFLDIGPTLYIVNSYSKFQLHSVSALRVNKMNMNRGGSLCMLVFYRTTWLLVRITVTANRSR